jgi:N-glycosidase YbiA
MDDLICFYEHEYYVFSNFSAFAIEWKGHLCLTSEHAYHTEKFEDKKIQEEIRATRSAHDSQKLAQSYKEKYRTDWNKVKVGIMKEILHAKVAQHPYVRKKLLQSGERILVEDSWRDDFWGWGPNKNGQNMLGKLWMEVRNEIRNMENA